MKGEHYTIKDIAKMASVSRGTVDRVIHGRGKVSKSTYKKVQLILNKLNYKPNLAAQTLRKGEVLRLAVLLPDYKYDIYWKRPFDGIDRAVKDNSSIGIRVDRYLYNPFRASGFRKHVRSILEGGYDGLLTAPILYRESLDLFRDCDEIGLAYITFNTYIEDSSAICHIGQDLKQSGQAAASLMSKILRDNEDILIVHVEEILENSRHMQEKELGFKYFFNESEHSHGHVQVLKINNIKKIDRVLLQTLRENPKIQGIYVSTSKVHSIAGILDKHSISKCLIGYDLLEENIRYLKSGHIDFLIYQNPGLQTNLGISSLVDHLLFKVNIPDKKLLPVEIVIRENIENYL